MRWQVWQRQRQDTIQMGLPRAVRNTLSDQFHLDREVLDKLRYLEKSSRFAGERIRQFRVFDPADIPETAGPMSYDSLDAHDQAILVEGRVQQDGYVHLTRQGLTRRYSKTQAS
jgi:hypothetical protein